MLYIRKQHSPPAEFLNAVKGIKAYNDLQGAEKEAVIKVLLSEQGNLCAFCERKSHKFTPTIEHFLPQSIFPELQLDYHNLYIACGVCNGGKGNYLIPAYIFDKRFAPDVKTTKDYPKPIYSLDDGKCYVFVSKIADGQSKTILPKHQHAHLLQNTLDLLHQNRDEAQSILRLRAEVWNTINSYLQTLPKKEIERKYQQLIAKIQTGDYPEFASLYIYLYQQILLKK